MLAQGDCQQSGSVEADAWGRAFLTALRREDYCQRDVDAPWMCCLPAALPLDNYKGSWCCACASARIVRICDSCRTTYVRRVSLRILSPPAMIESMCTFVGATQRELEASNGVMALLGSDMACSQHLDEPRRPHNDCREGDL